MENVGGLLHRTRASQGSTDAADAHMMASPMTKPCKGRGLFTMVLIAFLVLLTATNLLVRFPSSSLNMLSDFASASFHSTTENGIQTLEHFSHTNTLNATEKVPVVDAVFTWVNGSDPHFLAELAKYSDTHEKARYRDIGQLRYGLRSIKLYAPWIHHIFLVVSDRATQTPSWLNTHDDVTIVEHREIWDDLSQLPCFNSNTIESHLHKIPGVAEAILYFNDDVALTQPLKPYQHLWSAPGVPILYQAWGVPTKMEEVSDHFGRSLVHVKQLFNERYGVQVRKTAAHLPFLFNTSIVKQLQADWKPEFDKMSRFRSDVDMQTQFSYQQYVRSKKDENGNAVFNYKTAGDGALHFEELTDNAWGNARIFQKVIRNPKQFLCLQDSLSEPKTKVLAGIHKFYESLFPTKAPWEK